MPQLIAGLIIPLLATAPVVGVLGFTGIAYVALGIGYAATFGLLFAASVLLSPKPPKPEDVQTNVRQATPPRGALYGEGLLGGPWVFGGSKSGDFHKVIALSARKLNAILAYWVDDNIVTRNSGTGNITSEPYFISGDSKLRIESRLGLPTETHYSNLSSVFPEWTDQHRGDGVASLYARQKKVKDSQITDTFPSLINTLYRAHCEGVLIYDPTDEAQDIEDPDTWTYSDNLARIVMDYLWHADGMRVPVSLLTTPLALEGWRQAVEDCNDTFGTISGGSEPRYRCWTFYLYSERPGDVLRRMLQSGSARLKPTPDGGLTMEVGKWREPAVTIDETMIVGFEGVGRGKEILQTANTVFATYQSPQHNFQTTDAEPWIDDADVSERGEISVDLQLPCVPSHGQCRRLMKIAAHRSNPEWVGTWTLNRKGLVAFGEGLVNLTYAPFGISGSFEVLDFTFLFGEGGAVIGAQITIQSLGEEAFDWTLEEEGTPPPFDDIEEGEEIPLVEGFEVEVVQKVVSGVSLPYARLVWNAPPDGLSVEIHGKVVTDTAWTTIPTDPDATTVDWFLDQDGEEYEFQARHVTLLRQEGEWVDSDPETITAVGDPVAPGALSGVAVTGGQLGHADVAFTTPASANVAGVKLYRVPTGNALDRVAHYVGTLLAGTPSTPYTFPDGDDGVTNLVVNPGFDADTDWTKGTGWAIAAGVATKTPGVISWLDQSQSFSAGTVYRMGTTISGRTAGDFRHIFLGGTTVNGTNTSTNGTWLESLTAVSGNNLYALRANGTFDGSVDNTVLFAETVDCAPQGTWDYYLEAVNGSGVAGTTSGPHTALIY